ncbi:MAG: hypothetical protein ISR65_05405 [Bacteriovoracaceae bacterium]|nr:hypothetical protein [Bacteriovoracaceae bacterium]
MSVYTVGAISKVNKSILSEIKNLRAEVAQKADEISKINKQIVKNTDKVVPKEKQRDWKIVDNPSEGERFPLAKKSDVSRLLNIIS